MHWRFAGFLVLLCATLLIAATSAQAVSIEMVTVGDPGNASDTEFLTPGAVGYAYQLGKYEVTTSQYAAFLNAVAADDTYGLYNANMYSNSYGCKIERLGSAGGYTYQVAADRADRPVNYVSWGDAARFINWLHNGQPTGAQTLSTTEDGAYYLNGANDTTALMLVTRKTDAKFWIPTQDEWYKGAYYDPQKEGGAGYWDYATRKDAPDVPSNILTDPDSGNNANYRYSGDGSYTVGSPYWTTPVGSFEYSVSAYGTFDQNGNLSEWLETGSSSVRFIRSGSFINNESFMHANYTSGNYNPTTENFIVGIRVAGVVPEPGTFAMLAGAAAAAWLFLRRRKK
ncbi:MAG: SUMF1/EgtB/PvdO family nonheme iron enzyme [Pirellulaceae bacterium]|nr:SUMF1/EgtB/PvdO family nonheme iron enzyme [Pirellulaceae bacterium]